MVDIRLNPNLTEEDLPRVAEELAKLSSLTKVEQRLLEKEKSTEPLSEEKMQGSSPRDNDVFRKDFVEGALELAEMLGIADRGTVSPSKGLSFKAKNFRYYDFMEFWTALIKRFQSNEARLNKLDDTTLLLDNGMRTQFDYSQSGFKLADYRLETHKKTFEEAVDLITNGLNATADRQEYLLKNQIEIVKILTHETTKRKKYQRYFWSLALLSVAPCVYFYGLLFLKLFGG